MQLPGLSFVLFPFLCSSGTAGPVLYWSVLWLMMFTLSQVCVISGEEINWETCLLCVSTVGWWPTGSTEPGWSKLIYRRRQMDKLSVSGTFLIFLRRHKYKNLVVFLTALALPLPNSVNGDVRFFEPRTPDSINVLQTVKGLTALDIHPQANLFAWWVCLCRHGCQSQEQLIKCSQFLIRYDQSNPAATFQTLS